MKKLSLAAASALTLALALPMIAHAGGHKDGGVHMPALDTNSDGAITRAEAEAVAAAAFAKIDTNADGFLTEAEQKAAREAHRAEMRAKWEDKRAGRQPREPEGERRPAKMEARKARMAEMAAERFDAADTDGDGRWSQAEFTLHRLEFFGRLDADADGILSAAEIEAAKAERKERRGKWRDRAAGQ